MAGVNYELVIYDELPDGRVDLAKQLERIKASPKAWGKPVRIALYEKPAGASSARKSLEARWGGPESEWSFYARRDPELEGAQRGLFAVFTPAG